MRCCIPALLVTPRSQNLAPKLFWASCLQCTCLDPIGRVAIFMLSQLTNCAKNCDCPLNARLHRYSWPLKKLRTQSISGRDGWGHEVLIRHTCAAQCWQQPKSTELEAVRCLHVPSAYGVRLLMPGGTGWPGLDSLVLTRGSRSQTLCGVDEGGPGALSGTCILKIVPAAAL